MQIDSFELLFLLVLPIEVVLIVAWVFTEVREIISLKAFKLDLIIFNEDTTCLTKS